MIEAHIEMAAKGGNCIVFNDAGNNAIIKPKSRICHYIHDSDDFMAFCDFVQDTENGNSRCYWRSNGVYFNINGFDIKIEKRPETAIAIFVLRSTIKEPKEGE